MLPALALVAGAALALTAALLLHRRAPALAAGAGLVLLLVAVLRAVGESASLVTYEEDLPEAALLVAAGLAVGAGATQVASRRGALRAPVEVAAVVLAHAAVLTSLRGSTFDRLLGSEAAPPSGPVALLLGLLAGGALAALRPGPVPGLAAAVGLGGLLLVADRLDPVLVPAAAAGAAAAVLVPALVGQAAATVRAHPGPRLGQGVLAGLAVVVAVAAAQPYLDGAPERVAGTGETYDEYFVPSSGSPSDLSTHDVPLVPGFGLLDAPREPVTVVVTG